QIHWLSMEHSSFAEAAAGATAHPTLWPKRTPRVPGRAHLPLLHSCPGGVRRGTTTRGAERRVYVSRGAGANGGWGAPSSGSGPPRDDEGPPRRRGSGRTSSVAEDAGFEPARGFIPNTISNRAH